MNEAGNIAECLDALAFCDERIVVDGGSTDDTPQIAERGGARVISNKFEGFGAQKEFARSLATGDWVLSIDADERVSSGAGAGNQEMPSQRGADAGRLRTAADQLGLLRQIAS